MSAPMPARLYVIEDARYFSKTRLKIGFPELARLLGSAGLTLAALSGQAKSELIDRLGAEQTEALLCELADRELGWLVRGAWARTVTGPVLAVAASRLC